MDDKKSITPKQVAEALNMYFNTAELQSLALNMDIPYDDLEGISRSETIISLVKYTQRHGVYEQLIKAIQGTRPYINWDKFSQQSVQESKPAALEKDVTNTLNVSSSTHHITSDEVKLAPSSASQQLEDFYFRVNRLQQQFQEIQDITGLNDEETQNLLNLLEDAPHEFLRDLLSRHDDPTLEQYAQNYAEMEHELGIALVGQGKWHAGLRRFDRSLTIRRLLDNLDERADTIYQIGRTYQLMGNLAEAQIRYRDAMRLYQHTGNKAGIAACNLNLGTVAIQLGFIDEGIAQIQKARLAYKQDDNDKKLQEIDEIMHFVHRVKEKERV
ncbi:MAG: tetratricopeptide repeat protein [Anaerolineae bacterium]|nr:tetratricopeptide repeat protein [Anaerolineae bacterium]